jgi:hypothetical protein
MVDGGPCSPSMHAWPSFFSPHCHEQNLFSACVCKVTFEDLPKPLRKHTQSFALLGQFLKISHEPFVWLQKNWVDFEAHEKFKTLARLLLGESKGPNQRGGETKN